MHPTSTPTAHTAKQVAALRKLALAYPETHEDFPWGHSAFKVKGKAFAFLHADGEGFSISVKLPDSNALALHLPFAEPTGYGLGKSGWVTARFTSGQRAPMPVLTSWLEESFTAVAPKRMVAAFLGASPNSAPQKPASQSRAKRPASAKAPSPQKKRSPAKKAPQRASKASKKKSARASKASKKKSARAK